MYVCLCNGYRDSDIRRAAGEGVRRAADAYHALGQGPCCGACLPYAQQLIDSCGPPAAADSVLLAAE